MVKFGLVGLPEIHFLFVCPKEKKKALYICSENSKEAVKKYNRNLHFDQKEIKTLKKMLLKK